ncbi:MAG: hypothetical protein CMD02_00450 [Flavobacteriales bacterium]|nr:hypothetical protein [Flavobacteriales bacterium]|tara:strand:- start:2187 stop:2666 length:480 start_codon:yes stop_codon:yes gene_type:complete
MKKVSFLFVISFLFFGCNSNLTTPAVIDYDLYHEVIITNGIPNSTWLFSSNGSTYFQLDNNGDYVYTHSSYTFSGVPGNGNGYTSYLLSLDASQYLYYPHTHCCDITVNTYLNNNLINTEDFYFGVSSWVSGTNGQYNEIWCQSDIGNYNISKVISYSL